MTAVLPDQAARTRIKTTTGSTLFVNAGAGSGKTTALVDRIATLVLADGIPLHTVAAVTFTEKAGAELRDKLRTRFEDDRRTAATDAARVRCDEALDDLDAAAIGTLHAFAQRILMEHPIEAGLPPLLEVLDEVGSSVAFEDRWSGLQTELLDDDEVAEALLLGMACGVQLKHVRSLALFLGSDWDLIDDRVLVGDDVPVTVPDLAAFLEAADSVVRLHLHCSEPSDKLLPSFARLEELLALLNAAPDAGAQLEVLANLKALKFRHGQTPNWHIPVSQVRAQGNALAAQAGVTVDQILDRCLRALTRWTARRALAAAQERRAEGRLEFHDLLVLARDLLRRRPEVRAALHERYQRLLLDEFQDTDPIQIELAVRIAGGAEAGAADWRRVDVPEGRLFVVGDPKQSIYRFRRASIATYLDAEQHLGDTVSLTTNFRTVAPVLDWVNHVFAKLIQYDKRGQPAYEPLDRHRDGPPSGPAVTVLGAEAHADLPRAAAAILRKREAADVAGVIRRALDDGWQVYDEEDKGWRRVRCDDIAILVPARTSLPFLEDALEAAGVAYRAEASSLVYQAAEVRTLLACARAVADTSDGLSLVTALRSPTFGCGDDDLWRWKQAGGRFSIYSELEADDPVAAGPVGAALAYLRRLSFDARWLTPSEVLGAIVADRRMLEVAAIGPRERDAWRRLRFVVDQARAWSEVSHGGLRAYLAWAAHQGQETARVAEAVLPETDADAVRVMTVHAAKGLEFPIVILSGMSSQSSASRGVHLLWPTEGGYAVKLASGVQTGDFDAVQPVDEQMDGLEKRRLLYVAATRARDHLVVSLHRDEKSGKETAARLFADAGAVTSEASRFDAPADAPAAAAPGGDAQVSAAPPWQTWLDELDEARARARRVAAIGASGLEGTEPEVVLTPIESDADASADAGEHVPDGFAKGARDVELPPWSKGRYGSAIGRAVHGALQIVDLATGDGLDQAVAAQSLAEGVADNEELVHALVQSALDSDVVKRAAAREHWRETYVGTVQGDGTVLEGFVDLIYREDDGSLVVVDYKTDAIPAAALASRAQFYAPQMGAYLHALQDSVLGAGHAKLLFLHPNGNVATNFQS